MGHFRQLATVLILSSLTLFFISCSGTDGANDNAAAARNSAVDNLSGAKTNVEELSLLITIPYDTDNILDIIWKEDKAQKKLTVILRFDEGDTNKLVTELEKTGPGADVRIEVEDWFHDDLRSQSQLKGDMALKGRSYVPSQFYTEPYTQGTITRIEGTDFFVLELTSK
jgi:hypothetical protein